MPERYYKGAISTGIGRRAIPPQPMYTNIPATAEQYALSEFEDLPERTPAELPDPGDIYARQERDYEHAQQMIRYIQQAGSRQGFSPQDIQEAISIKGYDKVRPPEVPKATEKTYEPPAIIKESKSLVDMGVAPDIKSAYKMAKESKDKKKTKEDFLATAYQNITKNEMYAGDEQGINEAMRQAEIYYDSKIAPQKGGVQAKEAPQVAEPKQLDRETAMSLLKEAGGDKAKARQLAKERGYSF